MRIAIVHSYYSNLDKSGENNVVDAQIRVLRDKNHDVEIFASSSMEKQNEILFSIRSGVNVLLGVGDNPTRFLEKFKPDVILMHNLFPNISSYWIHNFADRTYSFKHNYRDLCASANFYRNGNICFLCLDKTALNGIKNSCYKNSSLMTAPIAIRNSLNAQWRPELIEPRKFIVLSERMKQLFTQTGVNSKRVEVIPNFIFDPYATYSKSRMKVEKWVAAGRIVSEKGFLELVEIWPSNYALDIYGDGPLLAKLQNLVHAKKNISLLGSVNRADLTAALPNYCGAILPSRWLEPGPLSVLEFLAAGLPIISVGAWSGAAGLDESQHVFSTTLSESDSARQLLIILKKLSLDLPKYSKAQREKYLNNFTPNHWYGRLMEIIQE